ncbi:MAG: T9SS C-terminal target domain-containing protein [Flavobacterium sp.]|nr:MAG: T9SS C-terminal target domain-containing protein [Flavobacterium sp.]
MKNLIPLLLCILLPFLASAQLIEIEQFNVGGSFNQPVDLQNAGDDRLFVVEKAGIIKILNSDGSINATPFIDINSIVINPTGVNDERGLLGLAFHPDYLNNGYFYVNYIDNGGDTQVSRFSVNAGNPDIADPGSELPIIDYIQPFSNHNGGSLAFGPDGYLYIAAGDGGSAGDPGDRAQNTQLLLGKLLRIDVDNPGGGNNYGIPGDNPFAGSPTEAEEIWAYGLRNPWKFSFDSMTDDLWIGDVGQGDVEEMNKQPATAAGLNYGWRCYEGSAPYNTSGCPPPGSLTFPEAEYSSSSGSGNCSVTGGYVYRGSLWPALQGLYFAADVCSGKLFTVDPAGTLVDLGGYGGSWVSFGVDNNDELFVVDISGNIYRIIDASIAGVNDNEAGGFHMIPNPASETVSLQIENASIRSLKVMSISGSIIISEDQIDSVRFELNVSQLQQGLYLVSMLTDDGRQLLNKLVIR